MREAQRERTSRWGMDLLLLFVVVVLLLQSPLAPFANKSAEYDGGVFIYGAKELVGGSRIYRDFFDHKGPLLYALNALGLWISNGRLVGIWCVEVVTLSVSALFSYRAARLVAGNFVAALASMYSLSLLAVLQPGQGVQHYALPLISGSLYLFLRGLLGRDGAPDCFSISELIRISCCFGLVLLLQPNLTAMWVGFGLTTAAVLLVRGHCAYVVRAAAVVVVSVAATLAPFLAYGFHLGVMHDALSCYWAFNRANPPVAALSVARGTYYALANVHKGCAVVPLFLYAAYLALRRMDVDDRMLHWGLGAALVLTLVVGCGLSGRDYPHYAIILIPLLCVTTAFVLEQLEQRANLSRAALVCIVAAFSWYQAVSQVYWTYVAYRPDEELAKLVSLIMEHSSPTDRIAVVGNDSQLYYLSGRKSSSRYHYTFPIADVSGYGVDIWQTYREDLLRNKPGLIIVKTKDYPRLPSVLESLVAGSYRLLEGGVSSALIYRREAGGGAQGGSSADRSR